MSVVLTSSRFKRSNVQGQAPVFNSREANSRRPSDESIVRTRTDGLVPRTIRVGLGIVLTVNHGVIRTTVSQFKEAIQKNQAAETKVYFDTPAVGPGTEEEGQPRSYRCQAATVLYTCITRTRLRRASHTNPETRPLK